MAMDGTKRFKGPRVKSQMLWDRNAAYVYMRSMMIESSEVR